MRLSELASTALVLLLNYRSPVAYDHNPQITSTTTVYLYIVSVEATIKTCSRADPKNAASYGKMYEAYHDEIARIVRRIGFLAGQEARFKGIGKETFLNYMEHRVSAVTSEIEQKAEIDPVRFRNNCRGLPQAAASKIGPFAPLVQRFPQEMELIKRLEDMETLP